MTVLRLALGDLLDRVRRPAYAFTLLAAVGLGYLAAPDRDARWVVMYLGDYRAVYNSAYVGTVTALTGALWLMLGGFYCVRDAIGRDERTGVGQLLAATPLRTGGYLLAKFASNLLLLGSMVGVLAGTALVMQLARGESRSVDPVALLQPFVVLALPILAATAAAALLFETIRPLRAGLGNVVWFFVWMVAAIGGQSATPPLGGLGVHRVAESMAAQLVASGGAVQGEFSLGLMYLDRPLRTFAWSGLDLSPGFVAERLAIVLLATLAAVLPALWWRLGRAAPSTGRDFPEVAGSAGPGGRNYAEVAPARTGGTARRLLAGELRILVQGVGWWWWVGAAVFAVGGLVAPGALALSWIWPVLVWSRLGTQRRECGVDALLGAYPAARRRVVAEWGAGVLFTALVGVTPSLHVALIEWAAGAVFIPTLALGLGALTRTPRTFQAVYVALWYFYLNI